MWFPLRKSKRHNNEIVKYNDYENFYTWVEPQNTEKKVMKKLKSWRSSSSSDSWNIYLSLPAENVKKVLAKVLIVALYEWELSPYKCLL